ncbi:MAG TPA: cyclic nucleotide-binding domain-containing protein [Actinomycetota bacterium]|jgi:CRP-like cAMP-binding protein|nr:cyclic nucleotide-binding domain-containing protein [Actinomycetota bacterium]
MSEVDPEALRGVTVFSGLSPEELARVTDTAFATEHPPGDELTEQGAYSHRFYLILDGKVSVERDGDAVATLGPGEFIGEISLLGGGKATATVRCEEQTRCLVLRREDFWSLLEDEPAIALRILEVVCRRLAEEYGRGPRDNVGER